MRTVRATPAFHGDPRRLASYSGSGRAGAFFTGVEQLVARKAHNLEVAGSSPAPSTSRGGTPPRFARPRGWAFLSSVPAAPLKGLRTRPAGALSTATAARQRQKPVVVEGRSRTSGPSAVRTLAHAGCYSGPSPIFCPQCHRPRGVGYLDTPFCGLTCAEDAADQLENQG